VPPLQGGVAQLRPNAISQAATFVGVCEGFLRIPANWDLWVHLFRVELHTLTTPEPRVRRAMRASGITISLRESHREFYIPCTMTSNNAEWERGWFYLRNDEPGFPAYTDKVLKEKADSWWYGLSPSSRQDRLESALLALKSLADTGLGAASVLANLHHRRVIPLMERELQIFEMDETADPVSLAHSRLVHDRFPREYAATRARRAISLKAVRHSDDNLWSFVMLPDAPQVSRHPLFFFIPPQRTATTLTLYSSQQWEIVNAVRSDRPTPRARARARSDPPTPRARARARRNGGSRSERCIRRSEGSGGGSVGNRETRNSGCTSSRDSLPWRPRITRRREREKRKRATGGRLPLKGGSPRPLTVGAECSPDTN
jgi:hypothetical protein